MYTCALNGGESHGIAQVAVASLVTPRSCDLKPFPTATRCAAFCAAGAPFFAPLAGTHVAALSNASSVGAEEPLKAYCQATLLPSTVEMFARGPIRNWPEVNAKVVAKGLRLPDELSFRMLCVDLHLPIHQVPVLSFGIPPGPQTSHHLRPARTPPQDRAAIEGTEGLRGASFPKPRSSGWAR